VGIIIIWSKLLAVRVKGFVLCANFVEKSVMPEVVEVEPMHYYGQLFEDRQTPCSSTFGFDKMSSLSTQRQEVKTTVDYDKMKKIQQKYLEN